MSLNWRKNDYFRFLVKNDDAESRAIQMLVDDLHSDKSNTVKAFLTHCGSEDFLWTLVNLLSSENARVAGNAAYILGTIAEEEMGQAGFMALINGHHPHKILADLTDLLSYEDRSESVMNAAGTIGTLADSTEGREWILRDTHCDKMIKRITSLMRSGNTWTASNAALVLARLSIAEEGCRRLLAHTVSQKILTQLIGSLGVDEAGQGMNAAFAIGRLCDTKEGQDRLLSHASLNCMIEGLCDMLKGRDPGCCKNACFALSCLAGNEEGHRCLLDHRSSDMMLQFLSTHLASKEREIGWFAAMTLRILAGRRRGVSRLRDHPNVIPQIEAVQSMLDIQEDTRKEINLTSELIRPLERPQPPTLEVKGANDILVTWPAVSLATGQEVTYHLYCDDAPIYKGTAIYHLASGLPPNSRHDFQLQVSTESDSSPLSEAVSAETEITVPNSPESLRILTVTPSQLRILWCPPTLSSGPIKGYMVYEGTRLVHTTTELNSIISGLTPDKVYEIYVCAYNHKGRGESASITARTLKLGNHAPDKPCLQVLGRSAIQATWAPPDNPLGRIHRYELTMDGEVVYSGWDLTHTVTGLSPVTEYVFTVIAVTNEGRCVSDPTRKRMPKKEYKARSTAQRYFSHPPKATNQEDPGDATKGTNKSFRKPTGKRIGRKSARSNSLCDAIIHNTLSVSKESGTALNNPRRHKNTSISTHVIPRDHENNLSFLSTKPRTEKSLYDHNSASGDSHTARRHISAVVQHDKVISYTSPALAEIETGSSFSPCYPSIGISHSERGHTKASPVKQNVKMSSVTLREQIQSLPIERSAKLTFKKTGNTHIKTGSERKGLPANLSKDRHRRLSLSITKKEVAEFGHSKTCCCDQSLEEQMGIFRISTNGVVLYAEPSQSEYAGEAVEPTKEASPNLKDQSTAEGVGLSGNESDWSLPCTEESSSKVTTGCCTLDPPIHPAAVNNYHFLPTHLRTQPISTPKHPSSEVIRNHGRNSFGKPKMSTTPFRISPAMERVVCMRCQGVLTTAGSTRNRFPVR